MINRCIARTGNLAALALLGLVAFAMPLPAVAETSLNAVYQGQTIRFSHLESTDGALAVAVADPGFQTLLRQIGALLTWKPGERYILVTTSAPMVISFAVGDRRYDVGPIALQARFAPYERGNEAFLPFDELLRSLDLALRHDGETAVLQPQLGALDIRQDGNRTMLLAHAATPLHPRIVRENAETVTYAFDGVATSLTGTRQVNAGGVRSMRVASGGTTRDPVTTITVELAAGAVAEAPRQEEHNAVLTFDGAASTGPAMAEESPTPEPEPQVQPTDGAIRVTSVTTRQESDGVSVIIAVSGNTAYHWHRLRDPDNRFWVDFDNAVLQSPIEQNAPAPLLSLRARQVAATTVRVALTLQGPKAVTVIPSSSGLAIVVRTQDVADAARAGNGSIGTIVSESQQGMALVTPAPLDNSAPSNGTPADAGWKFGSHSDYVPTNPRLIVLDPGHGGSDRGTIHGGVAEADLTLDMSKRLRTILIARGWEVKLTHDTDVDVFAPDDSAHDELQARVDIANKSGARLFVSIHANAFINAGPYGTTVYISKPEDVALGRVIEAHLASDGTKDDGVIKAHYYVTFHARMPAVLIETAFLSNPSDYALLTSPAWRQKVAQEIADGIGQYARENPVPNQPAQ